MLANSVVAVVMDASSVVAVIVSSVVPISVVASDATPAEVESKDVDVERELVARLVVAVSSMVVT